MNDIGFTSKIVERVLEDETSDRRFEHFCCELFSEIDGIAYVPTSKSWDLARDGRSAELRTHDSPPIILGSLRDDYSKKIEEDIKHLKATTKVKQLRFVSSQNLSEYGIENIKKEIANILPEVEIVRPEGRLQVAALCMRHPKFFEKYYKGELEELRAALSVTDAKDDDHSLKGMRIALTTQLSDDAYKLREDVSENLILTTLSDQKAKSLKDISVQVSSNLHLSRHLKVESLQDAFENLEKRGQIQRIDGKLKISSAGQARLQTLTDRGAMTYFEGKRLLRKLLQRLLGQDISEDEVRKLWLLMQEGIVEMFLLNGINIVEGIANISNGQAKISDHQDLQEAIRAISKSIEERGIGGVKAKEVAGSFLEMFQEKESDLFKWFTNLAIVYVGLCSLGLEPTAQGEIEARLRKIDLFLDTDIVLSYFCEGEQNHDAVRKLVDYWIRNGGQVFVMEEVLQEVAYHAWISQNDYELNKGSMGRLSADDRRRLIDNAFVRGFVANCARDGKGAMPEKFKRYISSYKGSSEYEHSKLRRLLGKAGVQFLGHGEPDQGQVDSIKRSLMQIKVGRRSSGELPRKIVEDKCERDAKEIVRLAEHREKIVAKGNTAIMLSSSLDMQRVCEQYKSVVGPPDPVIQVGAIGFLLALVPGVKLQLSSLRAILFDPGIVRRLSKFESQVFRVLRASEQYSVHWGRKESLMLAVEDEIAKRAMQRGDIPREFKRQIQQGSVEPKVAAEVIGSAIDAIYASKSEDRIVHLETENRELKNEIQRLRSRRQ